MSFSKLVLSGGGIKAIAYVGVIEILDNYGFLDTIDNIIGCSAGAIMGLLFVIGYQPNELYQLFTKINFTNFREYNVEEVLDKMGVDSGKKIIRLFASMMKQKGFPHNTTFSNLFQKTNKSLTIVGSDLTACRSVYFNEDTYPNMAVLEALHISISFPYVFQPVVFEEHVYIDGGVLEPFPIKYFGKDCDNVLGVLIHDRLGGEDRAYQIKTMEDKTFAILQGIADKFIQLVTEDMHDKYIQIDIKDMHSMDFEKGDVEKILIYQIGKERTKRFIKKYLKEELEKHLIQKYLQK